MIWMKFIQMNANIPISLSEMLGPREVEELLDEAQEKQVNHSEIVVVSIKEHLERRRAAKASTQPEGAVMHAALMA